MSSNDLFAEALPLRRPRMVADSRLESKPGEPLQRENASRRCPKWGCCRLPCPEWEGSDRPIHDRVQRSWELSIGVAEVGVASRLRHTLVANCQAMAIDPEGYLVGAIRRRRPGSTSEQIAVLTPGRRRWG